MLGFEIGQRESGFYSERTESQTDVPSSTVLVYRLFLYKKFNCYNFYALLLMCKSAHHYKEVFLKISKEIFLKSCKEGYRLSAITSALLKAS